MARKNVDIMNVRNVEPSHALGVTIQRALVLGSDERLSCFDGNPPKTRARLIESSFAFGVLHPLILNSMQSFA